MRSVVVGVLGLLVASLGVTAFAENSDEARAKQILQEINGVASVGLKDVNGYKYKMAGLCKFVGQLIPISEEAEDLSQKLEKEKGVDGMLSVRLMNSRTILYVAQVDICTAHKTFGEAPGYDKATEDQDADKLEQNLVSLVAISGSVR